jgi:hypothetical protein
MTATLTASLSALLSRLALAGLPLLAQAQAPAAPPAPPAPVAPVAPLAPAARPAPEGRLYAPGDFDAIDISGAAVVKFVQGPRDRIFVEGDEDAQKAVDFEVRDRKLNVRPAGAWKFWKQQQLQLTITSRELSRIVISGSADLSASGPVQADRLTISISGAGLARFDQLKAEQLNFQVSGAGDGQMAGSVKDLKLSISGRSEFRGENLMSQNAKVAISGIGEVQVWATQELAIQVAGFGSVDYWGTPVVRRNVSGSATITDRGAKRP